MGYHIDTGLIYEKFNVDCECPLCEIRKIVEEQFLYEFLNDAVMEENTRAKVNSLGFCSRHFEMLFKRPNKLSVALQTDTRVDEILKRLTPVSSVTAGKKQAKTIEKLSSTCIVCDLIEESMKKYYKTIAQMFVKENDFSKLLISSKGFCLEHYASLLKYSSHASFMARFYVKTLYDLQKRNLLRVQKNLQDFCVSHDYRNAGKPLGDAETALERMGIKLYGDKNS